MTRKEITVELINETLNETMDTFEKELHTLELLKPKVSKGTDSFTALPHLVKFTEKVMKCAQIIESLSALFEDAPKLACIHLTDNEFDKFREGQKELAVTNKLYERYRRLFNIYSSLLEDI